MNEPILDKAQTLTNLPPDATEQDEVLAAIRRMVENSNKVLVVLDDDPTGTQTVYDIPVLTEWSVEALQQEFASDTPAFYILTNSRSLPSQQAQAINQQIISNLQQAAAATGQGFSIVSRSDSTLRGHYPAEVDAITATLNQPIDACLIIPFFIEGGRYTINDVHYVAEGTQLIPAAQTPFAQDSAFGYRCSNLRQWVEEKTCGRFMADSVASISLDDIRQGGAGLVQQRLMALTDNVVCIVNAASMRDMQVFVLGLLMAEAAGKNFVYRTAASFVQARLGLAARDLLTPAEIRLSDAGGGLVIVGSYVPKTTRQVNALLEQSCIVAIEVNVNVLLDDRRGSIIESTVTRATESLQQGQDVVIYTSRDLVTVDDGIGSLSAGRRISDSLIEILHQIKTTPRYILAKGGITSSDVATKGLEVKRAMVMGQILPGVPVWRLGAESRYPNMPYIVFPGNVGDDNALAQVVNHLANEVQS